MKNNLKKQLCLLLSLLMLGGGMISCSDSGDGKETKDTAKSTSDTSSSGESETEPEETVVTTDLPDMTWGGADFVVLGRDGGTLPQFNNFEIYAEEMTADVVNDAVYERNGKLEAQYDVKISQVLYESDEQISKLKDTHIAGDQLYDCMFYNISGIGSLALGGYLYNLYENEYIDFTKPYWNADVNEKVSAYNKLYFTTSDFSLRDKNRAYIILYNTELAAASQIPDIVATVKEGKWTIDLMTEYAEMVVNDTDGSGDMSIYEDQWGIVMDSTNAFAAMFYGQDNILTSKDENDAITLPDNLERVISSLDNCLKACDSQYSFYAQSSDWSSSGNCYKAGRALFFTVFPHALQSIYSSCEFESTVIPFPKFDEEQQNYYTMADIYCMMFGIPSSCEDSSFSGFMLEALSCASTDSTLYAYYEVCCKSRYSYNQDSSDMLDLIFAGIRYEPSMIYELGGLYNIVSQNVPNAGQNNFSSLYAANKKMLNKNITKLQETFASLDY